MRFNPVSLVSTAMLVLTLFCAWSTRRDLSTGTTRWFGWARLAKPVTRDESPVRYWLAMIANIAVVLLFALAGAFAMRAGLFRPGRP